MSGLLFPFRQAVRRQRHTVALLNPFAAKAISHEARGKTYANMEECVKLRLFQLQATKDHIVKRRNGPKKGSCQKHVISDDIPADEMRCWLPSE